MTRSHLVLGMRNLSFKTYRLLINVEVMNLDFLRYWSPNVIAVIQGVGISFQQYMVLYGVTFNVEVLLKIQGTYDD